MQRASGRLRRAVGVAVRVPVGPWPLYPAAVTIAAFYSMIVRSFTRSNSQPEGAEAIAGMVIPVIVMAVATTAVAGLGMVVAQRLVLPPCPGVEGSLFEVVIATFAGDGVRARTPDGLA